MTAAPAPAPGLPATAPGLSLDLRDDDAVALGRASIAAHSRSFALASRLLPAPARDPLAVIYAWCRAADDAVDSVGPEAAAAALASERAELDAIYRGTPVRPVSRGFAAVARLRAIPEAYPRALLDGMAMDVAGARYHTVDDLIAYAYRVAGVVGLMACHVLGVRDDDALVPAAHLGIAMQLTNVCRDVAEDWQRGRLYLPDDLLARHGAGGLMALLDGPARQPVRIPDNMGTGSYVASARSLVRPTSDQLLETPEPVPGRISDGGAAAIRDTVMELLALADRYYASARAGYAALPWRAGLGVRAAGRIYRAIGVRLRRRGGDALAGRTVVSGVAKIGHVVAAAALATTAAPGVLWRRLRDGAARIPTRVLELDDVPRL